MLWQQGGEILDADGSRTAFASPAGVDALSLVGEMATDDKSVFVDSDPNGERAIRLFQNGKLAMIEAGPWVLPDIIGARIDYGTQRLPGFDGDHTTIAGSDNWVLFDNGDARSRASQEFVQWLTDQRQDDGAGESDPDAAAAQKHRRLAGVQKNRRARYRAPRSSRWRSTRARARPSLEVYPEISKAVGEAVVAVLLGRSSAQDALTAAAQRADGVLAGAAAGG